MNYGKGRRDRIRNELWNRASGQDKERIMEDLECLRRQRLES